MITMAEVVQRATSATFDRPIVINVFRSVLVEAIVAAALPEWDWCSGDYASHDFAHPDGTRLEVKQSAARQTWFTGRPSPAAWDIRARRGYWEKGVNWVAEPGRNAEIYVFAHHPVTDDTADHRNAQQWRFYVIATSELPEAKTISEARAARLTNPVSFERLSTCVEALRHTMPAEPPVDR